MSIEDRNLKPGTVLVARYKKRDHHCDVVKGAEGKIAFRVNGKEYGSPSAAGSAVMGGTACNGWRFWTPEGAAKDAPKPTTRPTAAKKATAKPKRAVKAKGKGASKAKGAAKAKPKASKNGKQPEIAGGANGEQPAPAEKPVNCGACGQEFPTSREAADHMRERARFAGGGGQRRTLDPNAPRKAAGPTRPAASLIPPTSRGCR